MVFEQIVEVALQLVVQPCRATKTSSLQLACRFLAITEVFQKILRGTTPPCCCDEEKTQQTKHGCLFSFATQTTPTPKESFVSHRCRGASRENTTQHNTTARSTATQRSRIASGNSACRPSTNPSTPVRPPDRKYNPSLQRDGRDGCATHGATRSGAADDSLFFFCSFARFGSAQEFSLWCVCECVCAKKRDECVVVVVVVLVVYFAFLFSWGALAPVF